MATLSKQKEHMKQIRILVGEVADAVVGANCFVYRRCHARHFAGACNKLVVIVSDSSRADAAGQK